MPKTSEEAVLLALNTREELFESLQEIISSDKRLNVLMALEEGKSQQQIADEVGVGNSTVSRAIEEFEDYDLINSTDNGYGKTLTVLDHPIIQHYYDTEVRDNGR